MCGFWWRSAQERRRPTPLFSSRKSPDTVPLPAEIQGPFGLHIDMQTVPIFPDIVVRDSLQAAGVFVSVFFFGSGNERPLVGCSPVLRADDFCFCFCLLLASNAVVVQLVCVSFRW